jgi:TatD DNase family protein
LIDIGVNLTNSRFDKDREDILLRAKSANIEHMLITGTSVESSQLASKLCDTQPKFLFSTAGVHPHDADNVSNDYIQRLKQLADLTCVKAIGECGLDFNRNFSTPDNQIKVFSEQVSLAAQLSFPLFLHQRDAFEPWLNILKPYVDKIPAMVSHCFTGNKEQLIQCLDHGMYIGITGWLCDKKRGRALRELVKYIPLDRLMIETDAPYLTPQNIKPKPKSSRNEPAYLPYIVDILSEVTPYSTNDIIAYSTNNAKKVFNFEC